MKPLLRFAIWLLLGSFITPVNSEEEKLCWVTGDVSGMITTQEAVLRTLLLPMNLNDPAGDANQRVGHGDYRLLGVGGLGLSVPPLNLRTDAELLCNCGFRFMEGTGDAVNSGAHHQLVVAAGQYAAVYNKIVLERCRDALLRK